MVDLALQGSPVTTGVKSFRGLYYMSLHYRTFVHIRSQILPFYKQPPSLDDLNTLSRVDDLWSIYSAGHTMVLMVWQCINLVVFVFPSRSICTRTSVGRCRILKRVYIRNVVILTLLLVQPPYYVVIPALCFPSQHKTSNAGHVIQTGTDDKQENN